MSFLDSSEQLKKYRYQEKDYNGEVKTISKSKDKTQRNTKKNRIAEFNKRRIRNVIEKIKMEKLTELDKIR